MAERSRAGHRLSSRVESARRKVSGGSHSRRRLWRSLAWSKKLERRSDSGAERTAGGNPPRLARRPRRYPQPLYRGNGQRHDCRMPLSAKWQSRAGTKVRLQAALVRPAGGTCQDPAGDRRADSARRRLQCHADRSRRLRAGKMGRRRAVPARGAGSLPPACRAGLDRRLRQLHPGERIYTFWKYFDNASARDAGLRIDHLLLSPPLAKRLVSAGADRDVRDREHASDHAPAWIELAAATAAAGNSHGRRSVSSQRARAA